MSQTAYLNFINSSNNRSSISEFYKSYHNKVESDTPGDSKLIKNDLNWKVPIIPKLREEYSNAHYLCPRCRQFPLIDFISKDYIYYMCNCEDRKEKK